MADSTPCGEPPQEAVVWPRELREAVRETVGGVAEEGKAGKYDSQYEDCPSVSKSGGLITHHSHVKIVYNHTLIHTKVMYKKRTNISVVKIHRVWYLTVNLETF